MNNNLNLDLSKVPKELKLILEVINTENQGSISFERYVDIDWNVFLQLALHHRLYPLLYLKIIKMDPSWMPSKTLESLSRYYKKNTFQMLQLCGEMEQLNKLFMEHEIRPLFLKGPVLAADLYGDISMRTCGDLDILIPIGDLEKANALLGELGYEQDEYIQTLLSDWKWRHHHFTYYHPSKGTKVEIHWRLHPAPSKEPNFNELWERKRESSITGYPTYFLGKEDLFYFLVTHGARHGWSRLRWLIDIHQIVKNGLNWGAVNKLLKRFHTGHIGGQSLILSSQLLNSTLNPQILPLIKSDRSYNLAKETIFYFEKMVNLHTDPVPEDISKYHTNYLFSLMSFQQKFIFLLSLLHPYYTDAETLPLPKKFHFLYYPLRPVLWVWRKTRKQALS
ncbi:nucleotidyltransferase domain-containing protein [Cytobacillus firmus]|uniref:nucleotidyltransferase domain-containing protein n=1 Tax=Cytobacillus firmus TaxID=1399 RepID=UPI001CFD6D2B|nr:nucleotidyltransferase family protein [Cytobacillus firmus]URT70229.1 nucleotidyltransferase family protein [Cytobacillus firmus]